MGFCMAPLQRLHFIGKQGQLLWCDLPNQTQRFDDLTTLETNGFQCDVAGTRSEYPNFDSSFVCGGGAWWGCDWVTDEGTRGIIVNSAEARRSEFVDCYGLYLFDLEIHDIRRPILVTYVRGTNNVSSLSIY